MHRREFLRNAAVVATSGLLGRELWEGAFGATPVAAAAPQAGDGPYGPLRAADANGIQLPAGFSSRVLARTGAVVAGTTLVWHRAPDGGACFAMPDGGWVYVSNAEVGDGGGGADAVRFASDGTVIDAYSILTGTSRNCAGGPTPWGTWLSCEEDGPVGRVWECDPRQRGEGVVRPALGRFAHEAAAVDPSTGIVYLTEDDPVGRLYRFVPDVPGQLTAGVLQSATVDAGVVTWSETSTSGPDRRPATTAFDGGEGAWFGEGVLYFTTKGDGRLWQLTPSTDRLRVLYDVGTSAASALNAVDNVTVHRPSGDVFVAEDGGNMELCLLASVGSTTQVAPFLRIGGHGGSEVTGPAFSPDGTRLYVSSQRGPDGRGVTYEIRGPFRGVGPAPTVAITALSPARLGQGASRRTVRVAGSGFTPSTTLSLGGGVTVDARTYDGPTQITLSVSVASSAATGTRTVTATDPGGGTASLARGFTVTPAPVIRTVTPSTVRRGRTTVVEITGANFASGVRVAVSGSGVSATSTSRVDATRVRVSVTLTSAAPTGSRSLTVRNTDGGTTTRASALTVA